MNFIYHLILCLVFLTSFCFCQKIPVSETNPANVSSFLLKSSNSNYVASNLIDFNRETAWVEGVKGDGENEWFAIYLGRLEEIGSINKVEVFVASGYQKTKQVFKYNNYVKELELELYLENNKIGSGKLICKPFPGNEYDDCWGGYDYTTLKVNKLPSASGVVWLKGIIKKIGKGTKYEDTGISEVFCNIIDANPFNAKENVIRFLESLKKKDKKIIKEFTNLNPDEFEYEIPAKDLLKGFNSSVFINSAKQIVCHWAGTECGDFGIRFVYDKGQWKLKEMTFLHGLQLN